jgi:hypothetical protein
VLAVGAAGASHLPAPELLPAVFAGSALHAMWVIIGILVERYSVEGMGIAEDVAAASTVVSPSEVAEEAVARCFVAYCRFVIELCKID